MSTIFKYQLDRNQLCGSQYIFYRARGSIMNFYKSLWIQWNFIKYYKILRNVEQLGYSDSFIILVVIKSYISYKTRTANISTMTSNIFKIVLVFLSGIVHYVPLTSSHPVSTAAIRR